MGGAASPVPADHPLMIAWEAYQATEDYANSYKWAIAGIDSPRDATRDPGANYPIAENYRQYVQGSLWAAFMAGFLTTHAWRPIETAPKDGTLLLLMIAADVDSEDSSMPTEDDLHNNFDHDGEDRWQFAGWCWSHDHFVEGRGAPTHWMPIPDKPTM